MNVQPIRGRDGHAGRGAPAVRLDAKGVPPGVDFVGDRLLLVSHQERKPPAEDQPPVNGESYLDGIDIRALVRQLKDQDGRLFVRRSFG